MEHKSCRSDSPECPGWRWMHTTSGHNLSDETVGYKRYLTRQYKVQYHHQSHPRSFRLPVPPRALRFALDPLSRPLPCRDPVARPLPVPLDAFFALVLERVPVDGPAILPASAAAVREPVDAPATSSHCSRVLRLPEFILRRLDDPTLAGAVSASSSS